MKIKTLIKLLEKYEEADIYFGSDEVGSIFFDNCYIETDNNKVLIYPFDRTYTYKQTKLEQVIQVK